MNAGVLKKSASFFRKHAAKIEIIAATLITLSIFITFYVQGLRVSKARARANHSFEVRNQIQRVYTKVEGMEKDYRDYILSGDSSFIAPYRQCLNVKMDSEGGDWSLKQGYLFDQLRHLNELVSRDSIQHADADRLNQIVVQQLRHMNSVIQIYKSKGDDAAEKEIVSPDGRLLSQQVQNVVAVMLSREYEQFRKQELIEIRYWQQNRIFLRGIVVALYFGLLVLVRISARRARRRYELELSLKEYDVVLSAIMDGGKYAITIADKNKILKSFNRAAERMYGYKASDFLGKSLSELSGKVLLSSELDEAVKSLSEELGRPASYDEVFEIPLQRHGFYEKDWTIVRKDGTKIPVGLSITAMRDANGELYGYLGFGQDLTERRKLDRIKAEFISTVSHELRTPLTSIRAVLGLMDAGAMDPEKSREMISIAHRNSERLVKITNDILDVEKIEFGKMTLHPHVLEVGLFIQQALETNQAYGDKYDVRFLEKNVSHGAKVMADPDRLMQVLANLLSNAAKFSYPISEVWVSAEARNGRVHFSVRDFGAGIPPEFHGRVFEKFAQADSSVNRNHDGSGLGLSITKLLVEAMGGSIGFESETGKGTTFFFDLPQPSPG